ncbi:hypothetical protein HOB10_02070 [Candidatus Parcubacteria bacterium]|nr:hypothetical protein [Candidatus Parcubacteria bacterium]
MKSYERKMKKEQSAYDKKKIRRAWICIGFVTVLSLILIAYGLLASAG